MTHLMENFMSGEGGTLAAAGEYMGCEPTDLALTTSTTMGLGLLYGGLSIRENKESLTTYHDHVPYHLHHARLTPGLLNTENEVNRTLEAIRDLRSATV